MNNVVAQKIATIERCITRARDELVQAGDGFRQNHTRQDAAVFNVSRAVEAAVDLANMLIRRRRWGIPTSGRDSFFILEQARFLSDSLSKHLQAMIGFRNIAMRQDQDLDLDIVEAVIRDRLDKLLEFAELVRRALMESATVQLMQVGVPVGGGAKLGGLNADSLKLLTDFNASMTDDELF